MASLLPVLFQLSEKRGKEASGMAVSFAGQIQALKSAGGSSQMLKSAAGRQFVDSCLLKNSQKQDGLAIIGHARLVTNGGRGFAENNQPVISNHCVGIHNGIIVNDDKLRSAFALPITSGLDSEVIFRLIGLFLDDNVNISQAVAKTFDEIEGEANIAFFHNTDHYLTLMTNTGSIYIALNKIAQVFFFASEKSFIPEILKQREFSNLPGKFTQRRLNAETGLRINIDTTETFDFTAADGHEGCFEQDIHCQPRPPAVIVDRTPNPKDLRRCTKCILPESFPLISFDSSGECNYCREYEPRRLYGLESLKRRADTVRKNNGEPDCIMMLSGGRDSSYGLHYLKTELSLNPVALTYDWGMVTDLARRNQSRICAKLGVEHIIRSPDIAAKRRNIRLNLEAWLKRPELGAMIPLLTAGDKQFYHYARCLRREYDLDMVVFAAGADLERTVFKTAFCGIGNEQHGQVLWMFPWRDKLRLFLYFVKQFVLNPHYFNSSLPDTVWAFFSTYIARDDFLYLFHYIPWDENEIMSVLRRKYHWEVADDTTTTWRIGDGTAAFYNYVFHTIAGFSEHDTFRSNEIRAGIITRDEALKLAARDNHPRFDSMRDYASLVGFNLDEALMVINTVPKLY